MIWVRPSKSGGRTGDVWTMSTPKLAPARALNGWRVPDWLWEKIEHLLPPLPEHPLDTHKRGLPKRQVIDAILLVLRTGMQWNALDVTGVCNSSTTHRRIQEWERAGVFHEIWRQGLLDYDDEIGIDWSWLVADGAMNKAPLGGPKVDRGCAQNDGYIRGWLDRISDPRADPNPPTCREIGRKRLMRFEPTTFCMAIRSTSNPDRQPICSVAGRVRGRADA